MILQLVKDGEPVKKERLWEKLFKSSPKVSDDCVEICLTSKKVHDILSDYLRDCSCNLQEYSDSVGSYKQHEFKIKFYNEVGD